MNELEQLMPWVNAVGVPGLLAIGLLALHRGWVVTGREHQHVAEEARQRRREDQARYEELKAERDEWKSAALRHLNVAERAVDTVAKAAGKAPRSGRETGGVGRDASGPRGGGGGE